MAVQLEDVDPQTSRECRDLGGGPVDEDADRPRQLRAGQPQCRQPAQARRIVRSLDENSARSSPRPVAAQAMASSTCVKPQIFRRTTVRNTRGDSMPRS